MKPAAIHFPPRSAAMRPATFFGLLIVSLLLTSCATPPRPFEPSDAGPAQPVDVSAIPDAVPRDEPRSKYGNPASYEVRGQRYHVMQSAAGHVEQGIASWYGTKFHNRRTSSGEPYDMYAMTAAHKTLPLPTYVRVTNLENGRSVVVKVNDRGPFARNRIIDLSYTAAAKLDIIGKGTGFVEIRAIDPRRPETPTTMVGKHPNVYLQIGSYETHAGAEQMLDRVSRVLPAGAHIAESVNGKHTVYRVRIGPIAGVPEADRIAAILTQSGIEPPHITAD